jgi:phosphotriesterase-related protein
MNGFQATPGQAQTVLGPIEPGQLGATTMHEHLVIDFSVVFKSHAEATARRDSNRQVALGNLGRVRYDPFSNLDDLRLLDENTAMEEANLFARAGGGAIVDVTSIGIGRDPVALARIARATGLHVVMGCGYYVDASHPPEMDSRSVDDIAEEMVADVTDGVAGTGVRAGIIGELGCSWPLTDNERKVLRAGAIAHRETGAAITVHPGRDPSAAFEILDILANDGADVERVVIGHLGRTYSDVNAVIELAERGCYLEYDQFGWESSNFSLGEMDFPSDAQRIDHVVRLVGEGYGDRLLIGQDVCAKHCLTRYGGYGYAHLLDNIAPRLRDRGVANSDLMAILVENPARVLAFA